LPIGTIVSFLLAGIVFRSSDYVQETKRLMLIQNCMLTLFGGGFFIIVKNKPEQSPSSLSETKVVKQDLAKVLKEAF